MRSRDRGASAPYWSRRRFLQAAGAGGAMLALPGRAPAGGDPDVVIIGAGASGLAAARSLIQSGFRVRVLEAADRAGGRAWTESRTFGVPFDHGASWLGSANVNPHREVADRRGIELIPYDDAEDVLFVDGRRATAEEYQQYSDAFDAVNHALQRAANAGRDVAASTVVPDVPFAATMQTWSGPMDLGVDYRDLSTRDYWEAAWTSPNYLVKPGYGSLVAGMADGLPIEYGAPVSRVDWGGRGVRVHSARGSLRARACIVTVSTGVLGAGRISFSPALPDWKQSAIHDLPMGLLAKIPLQFAGTRFGLPENSWLTYRVSGPLPAEACYFTSWPAGKDLMVGFVGGDFGFELSRAGREAAVDFALGELRAIFGREVDRHFVRGTLTEWAANPLTLGAYSAARPGGYRARREIGRPVGGRVFFAGEACAGAYVATCGGAAMSGLETAEQVAGALA